jgi:dihydrofolate synthase/folylpolyglutamate synthase
MFNHINKAIGWIESVRRFGEKYDLSRMEKACELLGHPEKDLPVIHIAGTNGKGSTVSFLKSILLEANYNVGTFTSPYIVKFHERITYNNKDISDEDLLKYINILYQFQTDYYKTYNDVITFFELLTLLSFLYFRDRDVDFVIYEVGLGGKLDATNVVSPLMTGITSISYDHIHVLGDTLEEIAMNKLGIVKEGIPLFTTITQESLYPLVKEVTDKFHAPLRTIKSSEITDVKFEEYTRFVFDQQEYELSLQGIYQTRNAALSIAMIAYMDEHHLATVSLKQIKNGLRKAFWPGRFERFGNVILDGAHNVGGAESLKETIQAIYSDKIIKILYTSMADKDYRSVLRVAESYADEFYLTEIDYPRCETKENLYEASRHPKKQIVSSPLKALEDLYPKENEILLITGSLYFISYIRTFVEHIDGQH